jgi:hypothetical protein
MESRLLGALGKVAGLGGIALGVFLLLFRGVLQKQFLPQTGLSSAQAFAVILALMILTFGIAAIGVVAWLVSRSTNPRAPISTPVLGLLAALIALILGAAVYVGAQARAGGGSEKSSENSITNIPRNTGIITQGQTGNNIINIPSEPNRTFPYLSNVNLGHIRRPFPMKAQSMLWLCTAQPSGAGSQHFSRQRILHSRCCRGGIG